MKKKLLLVMGLSVLLVAGGCAKKDVASELDSNTEVGSTEGTSSETTDTTETTAPDTAPVKEDYKVSDYIKLGQYKGVEVTVEKLEATEEEVDAAIQSDLEGNSTEGVVTGRPVQSGDIVNIDYEGIKDGVAFEGGTAEGYDLTIGSGIFIPGFEDQIIGANVGDNLELNVTFPEDYSSEELAGQPVIFKVKVNEIRETVVPELTEEYVKNNTDYDSIAAYREGTRAQLQAMKDEEMQDNKMIAVIDAVIANSEISGYPQTLLDYYAWEVKNYYTQQAAMFGMEFEDFIAAIGSSVEEFNNSAKSYAEQRAAQELVLKAIAESENITVTDAEYEESVAEILEEYGYASKEDLLAVASEKEIRESLLWEKVFNLIVDAAIEK